MAEAIWRKNASKITYKDVRQSLYGIALNKLEWRKAHKWENLKIKSDNCLMQTL